MTLHVHHFKAILYVRFYFADLLQKSKTTNMLYSKENSKLKVHRQIENSKDQTHHQLNYNCHISYMVHDFLK